MHKHILTAADLTAYQKYLEAEERAAAPIEAHRRDAERFAAWLNGREAAKESLKRPFAEDGPPAEARGPCPALKSGGR